MSRTIKMTEAEYFAFVVLTDKLKSLDEQRYAIDTTASSIIAEVKTREGLIDSQISFDIKRKLWVIDDEVEYSKKRIVDASESEK